MVRINVKAELGEDIVTRDHGKRLLQMIERSWSDPPIVIDFDGLQVTSVSFFDEAFGQLAFHHGPNAVEEQVRLERIDPFDAALVNDIIISRSRQAKKKSGNGSRGK